MIKSRQSAQNSKETNVSEINPRGFLAALAILVLCSSARAEPLVPDIAPAYLADLLARVRAAATTIPGAAPSGINYLKLAESHRPFADIIVGGSTERYVSARTVFQVAYPSGS